MATFFNEYFEIDAETLEKYGALNISIVNDLPLFIDPFLLFNSEKEEYRDLHARDDRLSGFSPGPICKRASQRRLVVKLVLLP
jgi:hypothetical protein